MSAHTFKQIHYWTYHSPSKPTCVFIHGFTGSHEGFQYIIPELKDYHVIVPDLPGFGESELTLSEYTIDALAKKVNEFVAGLNLTTPPYLVSHSMGGLVAASMLAQDPRLFARKTIFISPVATKVNRLDSRKIGELLGRLQYYLGKSVPVAGPRLVRSRLLSKIATTIILTTKESDVKKLIHGHHFKNLDYISSIDFYYQLHKDINKKGALDYASQLQQFKTLLVSGDRDNVTPLASQRTLATALNAKLTVIHGVGHLLHYEQPTKVAAAIADFLGE